MSGDKLRRDKVLHPNMEQMLEMLPDNMHVHLLTRHSIRELSAGKVASYKLPLTEEGVSLAEQWGAGLKRPIESYYSSAVGRCIDTAKAMARGQSLHRPEKTMAVQNESILMEPGSYVQNMALVGQKFVDIGPLEFVNKHLSCEITEGLLSPQSGAENFIKYFQSKNGSPGTFSLHVTHDTILAAFVYHLLGLGEITEEDWPWMMEGVFIWFDDESVHWSWRGSAYRKKLNQSD